MGKTNAKYDRTLIVRISSEQYIRLLETITKERKKGANSILNPIDKSKIIREMLDKYGSGMS
jgi:hypothetical protein